jgi:hypothetical protein
MFFDEAVQLLVSEISQAWQIALFNQGHRERKARGEIGNPIRRIDLLARPQRILEAIGEYSFDFFVQSLDGHSLRSRWISADEVAYHKAAVIELSSQHGTAVMVVFGMNIAEDLKSRFQLIKEGFLERSHMEDAVLAVRAASARCHGLAQKSK